MVDILVYTPDKNELACQGDRMGVCVCLCVYLCVRMNAERVHPTLGISAESVTSHLLGG